jgi:hypothetical protein
MCFYTWNCVQPGNSPIIKLQEFVENTMNELLGWYGYDRLAGRHCYEMANLHRGNATSVLTAGERQQSGSEDTTLDEGVRRASSPRRSSSSVSSINDADCGTERAAGEINERSCKSQESMILINSCNECMVHCCDLSPDDFDSQSRTRKNLGLYIACPICDMLTVLLIINSWFTNHMQQF